MVVVTIEVSTYSSSSQVVAYLSSLTKLHWNVCNRINRDLNPRTWKAPWMNQPFKKRIFRPFTSFAILFAKSGPSQVGIAPLVVRLVRNFIWEKPTTRQSDCKILSSLFEFIITESIYGASLSVPVHFWRASIKLNGFKSGSTFKPLVSWRTPPTKCRQPNLC